MDEQEVEFKVGNGILRGTLFTPEGKGPFPGVVFFHGRGSTRANYVPMAKKLAENGIVGLAFDFRGCGESDGEFALQTHRMGVEDARAGLDFLLQRNVDKKRIGIQGTSFGGYVTGMILRDFDFIKSVVLRVPASYSDLELDTTVEANEEADYFGKKDNWSSSSSFKGLETFTGDLLVIESEQDELILPEAVRKYYDDAKKAKKKKFYIQKGATHSFSVDPEGLELFHKMTVDWFLKTL